MTVNRKKIILNEFLMLKHYR